MRTFAPPLVRDSTQRYRHVFVMSHITFANAAYGRPRRSGHVQPWAPRLTVGSTSAAKCTIAGSARSEGRPEGRPQQALATIK
jgi:hypothetical protein